MSYLFYVNKIHVPDAKTSSFINDFNVVDFSRDILNKSLNGPTKDLEDNVQLHSAVSADCDIFLTADKSLLKMKFFGKARIASTLSV